MGKKGMKSFMKSAHKAADAPELEEEAGPSQPAEPEPPEQAAKQAKRAPPAPTVAAPDADDGEPSGPETKGQTLQRHKRELLAQKKAIQKLGKSKKDEAALLVQRLEERHAREMAEVDAREAAAAAAPASAAAAAAEAAAAAAASKYLVGDGDAAGDGGEGDADDAGGAGRKQTKAQKRKEKLAAREAEREARIAEELANLGVTERAAEEAALSALLEPQGLGIKEIRADGHCLYRSLEDQLAQRGGSPSTAASTYQALREAAATYMRVHKDTFAPFLLPELEEEVGVAGPDAAYEAYCARVEGTAQWGGHAELVALSGHLRRRIDVHAADMPVQVLGEEHGAEGKLSVCYLQHAFGLGDHYNSTRPLGGQGGGGGDGTGAAADADAAGTNH